MSVIYAALALVMTLASGCTHQKNLGTDDIVILNKSQFDGEWFTRATLVAKHTHSSFGFTGMECPVDRVKFTITKDQLLAYRSYERGSSASARDQNLVAAFTILDHVDDSQKGQDYGLDRPWYKRDSIKVDWSKNLAPHLECNQWLEGITTAHIQNTDRVNPSDPFRVRVEDGYIESTVDALVEPDVIACENVNEWSCQAALYRVKFSFRKINEQNHYEQMHYPDAEIIRFGLSEHGFCLEHDKNCHDVRELWLHKNATGTMLCDPLKHNIKDCFAPTVKMNAQFGFFRTEVQPYDRKEGFPRRERGQLINRWNIWQESVNHDGSYIPLAKRKPKKIIYYLNPGFPSDLLPSIKRVEDEWNTAFLNVIAQIKNKCTLKEAAMAFESLEVKDALKNVGINTIDPTTIKQACSAIYDFTKNLDQSEIFFTGKPSEVERAFGRMFEIKVNDCNQNRIALFLEENDLGDILYEHGIDTIDDDNIENACAVLESVSQKKGIKKRFDWQRLGDLRYSFVNAVTRPDADLLGYGPSGVDPTTGEIVNANANIYLSSITHYATKSAILLSHIEKLSSKTREGTINGDQNIDNFSAYVNGAINAMTESSYKFPRVRAYQTTNLFDAAQLKIFNSFNEWPTQEVFNSSSMSGDRGNLLAMIAKVPSNQVDTNAKNQLRERFFSERSACFSHGINQIPYARLTTQLKQLDALERINYIKGQIFESVLKHELGHTFGLRHNFKGAYDALNYPPNFWGVDTHDFLMRDHLEKDEMRSSSVMDYHKRFNSDFSGLGLYDYAALLSGYAGLIEVFDTSEEDFVPKTFVANLNLMDYKDLPYLFAGGSADEDISRHYHEVKDNLLRGVGSAHMQISTLGIEARPENLYKRRLINYETIKRQRLESILNTKEKNFVEVPYAFCTDGQALGQDIACKPFIFGSSASEIVENAIKDYELVRAIDDLGGNILPSNVPAYLNYVYTNVYTPILRTYQWMYATAHSENKIFPAIHDLAVGAKRGLDFISRVLQSVEPGEYCRDDTGNYLPKEGNTICTDPIVIDNAIGKKYQSTFGPDLAGSQETIGYVYDKILALLALIDDEATIDHEFASFDHRGYSIGFYRIFTPQLTKIFSHLYTGQWKEFSPTIFVDTNNEVTIRYRDLFNLKDDESLSELPKIKPSFSSTLRDYAILFSIAGLSNPLDHKLDFAKRAEISILANQSSLGLTDDENQIIFRDPSTGIGYRAIMRENEELSPGYQLLKDARAFVSDGRMHELAGPWYLANTALNEAQGKLKIVHAAESGSTEEVLNKLEEDVDMAQRNFAQKERILNEKIRVIEQVSRLSKKFAD